MQKSSKMVHAQFSCLHELKYVAPNSPDLNPLYHCIWKEIGKAANWKKVTPKAILIGELQPAVKWIRLDVVLKDKSLGATVCLVLHRMTETIFENKNKHGFVDKSTTNFQ